MPSKFNVIVAEVSGEVPRLPILKVGITLSQEAKELFKEDVGIISASTDEEETEQDDLAAYKFAVDASPTKVTERSGQIIYIAGYELILYPEEPRNAVAPAIIAESKSMIGKRVPVVKLPCDNPE